LEVTISRITGLLIADELWKSWQIGSHRDAAVLYQVLFSFDGAHNVLEGWKGADNTIMTFSDNYGVLFYFQARNLAAVFLVSI
jgi:hypothetical protein